MSVITPITANAAGCDNTGGCRHAYAIGYDDVTAVTVASGVITGFTLDVAADFAKMDFDDEENVAFFNEASELVGSAIEFTGDGLMQFNGITQAKVTAANNAKACCGVVVIWRQYDSTARVQGIDVAPDDSWEFSKVKARILPTFNSGTGAENSVMQYSVQHTGRYASATTDLTDSAIEAL